MGFDWSDYVRRREGLSWPHLPRQTESEMAEIDRGGWPPEPNGPEEMRREAEYQQWLKAPSGMGEQPSIINRDPGDETRALVLPPPSKTLLELIQGLEAAVAGIRADLDRLMVAFAALNVAGAATGATPQPHNHMANALAHSEPKPAWQR